MKRPLDKKPNFKKEIVIECKKPKMVYYGCKGYKGEFPLNNENDLEEIISYIEKNITHQKINYVIK